MVELLMIAVGFFGLFYGADWLVKGAARLAHHFGIPPIVIGLTIVSFGTSMPEQIVSLTAVFRDADGVSVGNVVGSNIANIALILGVTAVITPILINARLIRREIPLMVGISVLMFAFAWGGTISRLEGIILFAGILLFTYFSYRSQAGSTDTELAESAEAFDEVEDLLTLKVDTRREALRFGAGLVVLLIGAQLMVEGAVSIAQSVGISDVVIGLTLVALGTSLPELATSVMAAFRKEDDISVGNIVGSNIFNVLSIIGLTAIIQPLSVPDVVTSYDMPIMIAVSLLMIPLALQQPMRKFHGLLLLALYLAYTVYLFLR